MHVLPNTIHSTATIPSYIGNTGMCSSLDLWTLNSFVCSAESNLVHSTSINKHKESLEFVRLEQTMSGFGMT